MRFVFTNESSLDVRYTMHDNGWMVIWLDSFSTIQPFNHSIKLVSCFSLVWGFASL